MAVLFRHAFSLITVRIASAFHIIFYFMQFLLVKTPARSFYFFYNCMKLTTIAGFHANHPFPDVNP